MRRNLLQMFHAYKATNTYTYAFPGMLTTSNYSIYLSQKKISKSAASVYMWETLLRCVGVQLKFKAAGKKTSASTSNCKNNTNNNNNNNNNNNKTTCADFVLMYKCVDEYKQQKKNKKNARDTIQRNGLECHVTNAHAQSTQTTKCSATLT
ncbi:unnamed protein product [Ceratitis capitata]|uniref:(Mediterranean fruit fly) hypothetical protein n=1 Tax=Ceratitis capitata TaxID=7213 RepID=A0A811V9E7_CERCA|nr:unnamed protein product [Ceratitis capitata]